MTPDLSQQPGRPAVLPAQCAGPAAAAAVAKTAVVVVRQSLARVLGCVQRAAVVVDVGGVGIEEVGEEEDVVLPAQLELAAQWGSAALWGSVALWESAGLSAPRVPSVMVMVLRLGVAEVEEPLLAGVLAVGRLLAVVSAPLLQQVRRAGRGREEESQVAMAMLAQVAATI